MSYEVEVRIYCDHEGCTHGRKVVQENRGGLNKTWAGFRAVAAGWWVRGKTGSTDPIVAYCPEHRAEHGYPA